MLLAGHQWFELQRSEEQFDGQLRFHHCADLLMIHRPLGDLNEHRQAIQPVDELTPLQLPRKL